MRERERAGGWKEVEDGREIEDKACIHFGVDLCVRTCMRYSLQICTYCNYYYY